jgi:lipid-binding SYLF domain-containing protein
MRFSNRNTKSIQVFLSVLLLSFFISGQSDAGTVEVELKETGSSQKPCILIKGSDVNLINIYDSNITSLVLINTASEKRVLKIDELKVGQSVQIGFDKVGSYHLIYKIGTDSLEDIHKRLLIKVVNASSA